MRTLIFLWIIRDFSVFIRKMMGISAWPPERYRIFPATVLYEEMQQAGFWHGMRSWEMVGSSLVKARNSR